MGYHGKFRIAQLSGEKDAPTKGDKSAWSTPHQRRHITKSFFDAFANYWNQTPEQNLALESIDGRDQRSLATEARFPSSKVKLSTSTSVPMEHLRANAQLVRLIHGDENPIGPGFVEQEIDHPVNGVWTVKKQFTQFGSYCGRRRSGTATESGKKFLAVLLHLAYSAPFRTTPMLDRQMGHTDERRLLPWNKSSRTIGVLGG